MADGTCSAEGCTVLATLKTLTGIVFCDEHFSAFYTAEDGPVLKDGIVSLQEPVFDVEPGRTEE